MVHLKFVFFFFKFRFGPSITLPIFPCIHHRPFSCFHSSRTANTLSHLQTPISQFLNLSRLLSSQQLGLSPLSALSTDNQSLSTYSQPLSKPFKRKSSKSYSFHGIFVFMTFPFLLAAINSRVSISFIGPWPTLLLQRHQQSFVYSWPRHPTKHFSISFHVRDLDLYPNNLTHRIT